MKPTCDPKDIPFKELYIEAIILLPGLEVSGYLSWSVNRDGEALPNVLLKGVTMRVTNTAQNGVWVTRSVIVRVGFMRGLSGFCRG